MSVTRRLMTESSPNSVHVVVTDSKSGVDNFRPLAREPRSNLNLMRPRPLGGGFAGRENGNCPECTSCYIQVLLSFKIRCRYRFCHYGKEPFRYVSSEKLQSKTRYAYLVY